MTQPVSRRLLLVLLLAYLPLRVWLASLPGCYYDLDLFKRTALGVARHGISLAYEKTAFDYPPLYLYLLYPAGVFHESIGSGEPRESPAFTLAIKLPYVAFDLLIAWLIYRLVSVEGLWGRRRADPAWGRLAALLYLWNPAVLWCTGYWGMPDGIHTTLALASVSLLIRDRWVASGAALAAGGTMKPLVAPLAPLVGVVALMRGGWRGGLAIIAGGLAVVLLVLLPFISSARVPAVVERVLIDFDKMPYASVNAHNLWWIAVGAWQPAGSSLLVGVTPTGVGLAAFGLAFAVLLIRNHRWIAASDVPRDRFAAGVCLLSAALCASFFFFTTHMHENHLFLALALLLCVAGRHRLLAWLAVGFSVALLTNMLLHDSMVPYGLPFGLSAPSSVMDPGMNRPFTWLQIVGGTANSLLVGGLTAALLLLAWGSRARDAGDPMAVTRSGGVTGVAGTGAEPSA